MSDTLRIGILGAAGIAPNAIILPARAIGGVEAAAVAGRDRARAEAYAAEHGIPRVHESYAALIADPDIDVVYNPTPNGLHGRWTAAAVRAGKHVLAEKPFTANAAEAREVAAVVADSDRIVMEAFHYRYHPLMLRALEILASGELGALISVEGTFLTGGAPRDDIRWSWPLAGGALMDLGCYPVHMLRHAVGAEPTVLAARAIESEPRVDGVMEVDLEFPGGVSGLVRVSMVGEGDDMSARFVGENGVLEVQGPWLPQLGNGIRVIGGAGDRVEEITTEPSYNFQLRAFLAVLDGAPLITGVDDAIGNMEVIDAAYRAAGLPVREPTP
ncbi:MAG TPA: Gfo/Idh/MocA family oxidoreductase [Galbitalea sp.]